MKTGRINKRRAAPKGFVCIDKNLARTLYELGHEITVAGNNVNSFHIFDGWRLGYTFDKNHVKDRGFDDVLNNFRFYLEPELGRYLVFYTKKENVRNFA